MMLGQFSGKVDTKGRVAFPKKFREVIGERLLVTKGYEHSLIIVSQKEWEMLLEGTKDKAFLKKEVRDTQRFLLGNAFDITLDSKGRVLLPEYLRKFGGITEDVVFLGLSRYVEVWGKEMWEMYRGELEKNITHVSERLLRGDGE